MDGFARTARDIRDRRKDMAFQPLLQLQLPVGFKSPSGVRFATLGSCVATATFDANSNWELVSHYFHIRHWRPRLPHMKALQPFFYCCSVHVACKMRFSRLQMSSLLVNGLQKGSVTKYAFNRQWHVILRPSFQNNLVSIHHTFFMLPRGRRSRGKFLEEFLIGENAEWHSWIQTVPWVEVRLCPPLCGSLSQGVFINSAVILRVW